MAAYQDATKPVVIRATCDAAPLTVDQLRVLEPMSKPVLRDRTARRWSIGYPEFPRRTESSHSRYGQDGLQPDGRRLEWGRLVGVVAGWRFAHGGPELLQPGLAARL